MGGATSDEGRPDTPRGDESPGALLDRLLERSEVPRLYSGPVSSFRRPWKSRFCSKMRRWVST
jgi:hypothetical protein